MDEEKGVYNKEDGSHEPESEFPDSKGNAMWRRTLKMQKRDESFQFVRQGYFCVDAERFKRRYIWYLTGSYL